jgi:hypothetical protein
MTMGNKVQGEGDYESAREYNDETRKFVDEHTRDGKDLKGASDQASDELTPPEREALARAKSGGQDKRDAKVLSDLEKKRER